jgi:geranylgeranyl pyrophosphate synthase
LGLNSNGRANKNILSYKYPKMLLSTRRQTKTMEFDGALEGLQDRINDEIESYFKERIAEAGSYHSYMGHIYSKLRSYVLRPGKRLMSLSCLLTYLGYSSRTNKRILRACVAIELYRHGILIHDDIVDGDETRRGGPAFHKEFDEETALFAGNILISLAFKLLIDLEPASAASLARDYQHVNESQILDFDFEGRIPTPDEWMIMASKRAPSVFRVTMLTGALLAGAEKTELKRLDKAAFHIGMAFDIQDDLIGLFNQENNDISRKKKPLHICYAHAMDKGFSKIYSCGNARDVAKSVKSCGAFDAAKKDMNSHARKAAKIIEATRMSDRSKGFYKDFIKYITNSMDWYS